MKELKFEAKEKLYVAMHNIMTNTTKAYQSDIVYDFEFINSKNSDYSFMLLWVCRENGTNLTDLESESVEENVSAYIDVFGDEPKYYIISKNTLYCKPIYTMKEVDFEYVNGFCLKKIIEGGINIDFEVLLKDLHSKFFTIISELENTTPKENLKCFLRGKLSILIDIFNELEIPENNELYIDEDTISRAEELL